MTNLDVDLSGPPGVPGNVPEAEQEKLRSLRFQASLDDWKSEQADARKRAADSEKAEQDASTAIAKAQEDARIAAEKAEQDASTAIAKAQEDARIAMEKSLQDADIALEKGELDQDLQLLANLHASIAEVAKASIERSRTAATFVQGASAAIGTAYTGILAFTVVGGDDGAPLPVTGLIPVMFLGAAIALAAGYVGFIDSITTNAYPQAKGSRRAFQMVQTAAFVDWINATVLSRGAFLRASVVSLGIGAAFLPVGLLEFRGVELLAWRWALAGAALVVAVVVGPWIRRSAMTIAAIVGLGLALLVLAWLFNLSAVTDVVSQIWTFFTRP